jgi:hypothetical protein
MSIFGQDEFLLGVEFEVTCNDGTVHENIVYKYCADGVLRWYQINGTQVRDIASISRGCIVVNSIEFESTVLSCQEER